MLQFYVIDIEEKKKMKKKKEWVGEVGVLCFVVLFLWFQFD